MQNFTTENGIQTSLNYVCETSSTLPCS